MSYGEDISQTFEKTSRVLWCVIENNSLDHSSHARKSNPDAE